MIRRMEKIGMEVNSNSIIYFIVFPRFYWAQGKFASCNDFFYFLGFG